MPQARIRHPRTYVLLSSLLLPAAGAVVAAPPAVHASPPPASAETLLSSGAARPATTITLQAGDTLWGLSRQYGIPVAVLQAANGLGTSTLIYAGRPFVIPGGMVLSVRAAVDSIARSWGVTPAALAALNDLHTSIVEAGTRLYLPASPAAPTTAAEILDLAHLVQSEAGNQPFLGQVAVAAVVLNRMKAPGFPKTVAGVIFQPGQFESVSNGTFWMAPDPQAYQAAEAALNGEDPTGGALYYYNPSLTTNKWMEDLPVLVTIGAQVFCR